MVFGCTEWKTSFDRCFATLVIEKFELRAGCTQGHFKASQMAKSDENCSQKWSVLPSQEWTQINSHHSHQNQRFSQPSALVLLGKKSRFSVFFGRSVWDKSLSLKAKAFLLGRCGVPHGEFLWKIPTKTVTLTIFLCILYVHFQIPTSCLAKSKTICHKVMQKFSKPFLESLRSFGSKKLMLSNFSPLPAARRGNPPSVTTNNSGGCTQAPMKRTRRGCRNFRKASTSFFMASQKPSQIRSMFRLNRLSIEKRWKKNQDDIFKMKSLLETSSSNICFFLNVKNMSVCWRCFFSLFFVEIFEKRSFCKFASRWATPLMRFTATYEDTHLGNGVAVDEMTWVK